MKVVHLVYRMTGLEIRVVHRVYHQPRMSLLMELLSKSNIVTRVCYIVHLGVLIVLYAITVSSVLITIARGLGSVLERYIFCSSAPLLQIFAIYLRQFRYGDLAICFQNKKVVHNIKMVPRSGRYFQNGSVQQCCSLVIF